MPLKYGMLLEKNLKSLDVSLKSVKIITRYNFFQQGVIMRQFIKNRCNKDNFWNLMFFVVLFGGTIIAFASGIMIISWFAIAGSIWIAKRNSIIVFDEEQSEFVINGIKRIKARGGELIMLLLASFVIVAIIGFILDGLKIDDSPLVLAMMGGLLISLPVLYCILRNFPIAVYFKKEAWTLRSRMAYGSRSGIDYTPSNFWSNSSNNNRSLVTDPSYRYLSCNVYHRN